MASNGLKRIDEIFVMWWCYCWFRLCLNNRLLCKRVSNECFVLQFYVINSNNIKPRICIAFCRLDASDCRVKAGEWELGSDNEPLKFQLVGAKYIRTHPTADMALIRLERSLTFAQHIKPICISDKDPDPNEQCLTSGWGQQALRGKYLYCLYKQTYIDTEMYVYI